MDGDQIYNLSEIALSVFSEQQNSFISQEDIIYIITSLARYKGLKDLMEIVPRHVFSYLFKRDPLCFQAVLPVEIADIRIILENKRIQGNNSVVLLSSFFFDKIVSKYDVYIKLKKGISKSIKHYGQCYLLQKRLDIEIEDIDCIICKNDSCLDFVRNILKNMGLNIAVHVDKNIPGVESMPVKESVPHKKEAPKGNHRYKIVLSPLQISETAKASSDYEALESVLARRWDLHPDSETKQRPARYFAEYWKNSGFWDQIVRRI